MCPGSNGPDALLKSIRKPVPLGFRSLSADAAMTEVMSCRSTVLSASSCVLVFTPISDTVGVDSMWGGGCTSDNLSRCIYH